MLQTNKRPPHRLRFTRWHFHRRLVACAVGLFGALVFALGASPSTWREDYATIEGFRIQRDTTGYHLPTAIAFVPEPGPDPKDPLYYVAELRGTLKVVTNDRTVLTFAEGFQHLIPRRELPDHLGEIGMAGLCLEPEQGYIFVSYAYEDKDGIYRNAITRFDTQPRVFGLKPKGKKQIAPFLDSFVSNLAHQIGPLVVVEGNLYVNVGDSMSPLEARDLDYPSGKTLRMTLDGLPLPDNPWAIDDDPRRVRNYLWAIGFRNPFSLVGVKGRLFAAENGLDIDRFVEVKRGEDYLYGGDASASGANALYVWSPAVGPVQLSYDVSGRGTDAFPKEWRNKFFLALAGSPTDDPGPDHRRKSVVAIGVDLENNRLSQIPRQILRYVGSGRQLIVGVASGPDGLYVVPMLPDAEGATAILHLDYRPESAHPILIGKSRTAEQIVAMKCLACHRIDGRGLGSVAPVLSRLTLVDQILKEIDSAAYLEQLRSIDSLTTEPFVKYRQAREEVRAATGEDKARLWIKYRILEPKFDRTIVAMPNLGLNEEEAGAVANWLVEPSPRERLKLHIRPLLGTEMRKNAGTFSLGALVGFVLALGLLFWVFRKR